MANLTRLQCRDYIRGKVSRLDQAKIIDGMLNIDINLAQRKVQRDLMDVGLKPFTKHTILTGNQVALPTDLLAVPDAIIDVGAGTGTVRAYVTVNYTTPTADLTHTFREPGTPGNSKSIVTGSGTYGTPSSGVLFQCIGGNFYFDWTAGQTCTQIVTAANADTLYSRYFVCSTTTGSAVVVSSSQSVTTAGGTGTGFYPADERPIEEFNRIANNSYLNPVSTSPVYMRNGNQIQFLPNTVTYSYIFYKYLLADLTADTDKLTIPIEYEELLLTDLLAKTYLTLKQNADSQATAVEYQAKVKELEDKYNKTLTATVIEKQRIAEG